MTVIIKPIDKNEIICDTHYRKFEDVESIDDNCFPLIKIRHKAHNCYALMKVPDNCYVLVIKEDNND